MQERIDLGACRAIRHDGDPAIEVLELPGVDHAVQVPGDPRASADALARLVDGVARFVEAL